MSENLRGRFGLALRNVLRHRFRTAATLAAISIGVAGLILAGGFVEDIFVQLGEAIIHSQTGHLQVVKAGYREGKNRAPQQYLFDNPKDIKAAAESDPAVEFTMARLGFSGVLNNGKRDLGILGEGVEPDAEARLGSYLHYVEGRSLSDKDMDGIAVGQGVASSLGLKVGDRVTLVLSLAEGAVNTLDFELIGVFQSFSKEFDSRAVRIPLAAAQSLMDTQAAHLVVVTLKETRQTERARLALEARLASEGFEIIPWTALSDFYEKTIALYDRQVGVLRSIILVMVLLSVANSVNMSLFERTREFGTMLALGNRSRDVFLLILTESAITGVFGALIGTALGVAAALAISSVGIPMPPPPNANLGYTAIIRIVPGDIFAASLVGFFATVLAALMPARRAARLGIVDALRQGV